MQKFFRDSIKLCFVGRFRSGKTWLLDSAYTATGEIDGARYRIQTPILYGDVEGGTMSMPKMRRAIAEAGQPLDNEHDVRYMGIHTEEDFDAFIAEARSGLYRLAIFDSWSKLYEDWAMLARETGKHGKNRNASYNLEAADAVAEALKKWFDLAVLPATRGMTLLSTAAITDHFSGDLGNKVYLGERIAVSDRLQNRIVGGHAAIWHCHREDPVPIQGEGGRVDIEATNAAIASGHLGPRFLVYTQAFAGMQYVKSQAGFAAEVPAIATGVDLGEVLSRHHDREGVHAFT